MSEEYITPDSVLNKDGSETPFDHNNNLLVIFWILAPFPGIIFKNDKRSPVRWHARITAYFGLIICVLYGTLIIIARLPIINVFVAPTSCIVLIWTLFDLIIRFKGAIHASEGKKFKIPLIYEILKSQRIL